MRILYLNHNVAGTGTYQRALNFARQLASQGHEITLLTTSRTRRRMGSERMEDGVRIVEAPDLLAGGARNGWDPWNTGWRVLRLGRESFDLIHAFDCRPVVIGPALAQQRRTGAPLFIDWADWWGRGGTISERSGPLVRSSFGPVETWFEERFRTVAAGNTTISEALRQRCMRLGVPGDRVLALPNGCVPPFDVKGGREGARSRSGVGAEPLLVHLGVAHAADAALLFEAFRRVRESESMARLVLLGSFRSAVPADLTQHVLRTGYVTDEAMRDWLAGADAAVIPMRDTVAHRARWPGKVNEYFSAGVPVVMPRVGAAAQWVDQVGAGITCGADTASFADAMVQALRMSDAERTRMGEAGRQLAAGALAWERVAGRLLEFYTEWGAPRAACGSPGTVAGVT